MPRTKSYNFINLLALYLFAARIAAATPPDRITRPIDANRTTAVTGNVDPRAQSQFDRGPVDPTLPMRYMMLIVQPSKTQQADLDQLLANQQNPSSPLYHRWLTPAEFGNRFGLSPSDHSKVVAWLTSQGFTVNQSARGRNWIAFSGTAGQVSRALHTPIDHFAVNGETHYANATSPAVPESLAGVVGGFLGLSDFHPHSLISKISPADTLGVKHYLAPQDWATIYDVAPLYQAGFDGTGQSIAVVGESDVPITDIRNFRTHFGLPANDPKMVSYDGNDPGYNDAQIEGDLDLQWSGAIAPQATIYYVYGADAFEAVVSAVDLNVAPVITTSYGFCEIDYALNFWRAVAQQGNAQGITLLNASGDSGAAGCDYDGYEPFAVNGLAVDFPAVLPEVTGVGGTQFMDLTGNYWSSKNTTDFGSALSYIPEAAWNESSATGLGSGGGGASALYAKPLWQTGPGVPNDNARDVPDLAFSSAAGHDGYMVNYNGGYVIVGGTSCSSPSFSGVVAILNQYEVSNGYQPSAGLGNINPQLYRLAQNAPSAFNDVTVGNNIVNCAQGSPGCLTGSFGYPAGPGYDQATGLGSVDANNLVTQWNIQSAAVTVSLSASATATVNDTVTMTATVTPVAQGTPTGAVAFSVNGVALGTVAVSPMGGQQGAHLSFPAYLAGALGPATLVAQYSGDTVFSGGGATATIRIGVPKNAAAIVPSAPDTVWPSAPDAQGLSWSTPINLAELGGYAALVTGFSIDGAAQPLAQYFPSPTILANGSANLTVVRRNLTTPSTHTFGFNGIDVNGNNWSVQVSVNFFALPPGSFPLVTATPLVVAQNPKADPSCQWPIQLNIDEIGGNVGLEETNLIVGNVDWSDRIPQLFGTVRLTSWADLQGTICLGGITPPATETILTVTDGEFAQELTVSLTGPVPNPTQLSVSLTSATLNSVIGGTQGQFQLGINVGDPKATWTASVFPANRTTAWLGASQFSGAGPAQVTLTANGAGFEPGVYRANLAIQSPTALPQTVNVPIMFVNGPAAPGMAITAVANSANYSTSVAPGMVVSVFGTNLANTTDTGTGNPLPYSLDGVSVAVNGIAAPIVYISPTQINIQIPYEAGSGQAVVGINNNGQIAGSQFPISASAPGIYVDGSGNVSPTSTVAQGGVLTLYLAGAGEVTNQIDTGYAPSASTASDFQPMLPVSVTVGGTQAFVLAAKLTANQVGTTQLTILVPPGVAAGVQPVVVTIGGVASAPANITVQ